jgi:hypothetical protein
MRSLDLIDVSGSTVSRSRLVQGGLNSPHREAWCSRKGGALRNHFGTDDHTLMLSQARAPSRGAQ